MIRADRLFVGCKFASLGPTLLNRTKQVKAGKNPGRKMKQKFLEGVPVAEMDGLVPQCGVEFLGSQNFENCFRYKNPGAPQSQDCNDRRIETAAINFKPFNAGGFTDSFARPRLHHATALHEMDPRDLSEVAAVARALANAQGLENYNLLHNAGALAGQTVFHAHFHLIPKWSEQEGFRYTWKTDGGFDQQESYLKIKEALNAAR